MRRLIVALAFLTRLPVRAGAVEPAELARSVALFPVVGAVLGAACYGSAFALMRVRMPELSAIAIVALLALLTGALHLDGLADVFDGLGGGRGDRVRTLAIMRDSRIGAHGAVALVLFMLAKVAATRMLIERDALYALWIAPSVSRFAVVPLIAWFPYAREQGLGQPFHALVRVREIAIAAGLLAACLAPFGARTILPALGACAFALCVGFLLKRKLGGLTGDAYGAAIEFSELTFLCASAAELASHA